MKPFNIKIRINDQEVTLTISPYNQNCYRVIYFGGILGAIEYHPSRKDWSILPLEQAVGDDLPPYTPDDEDNRIEITLNTDVTKKIIREIIKQLSF